MSDKKSNCKMCDDSGIQDVLDQRGDVRFAPCSECDRDVGRAQSFYVRTLLEGDDLLRELALKCCRNASINVEDPVWLAARAEEAETLQAASNAAIAHLFGRYPE